MLESRGEGGYSSEVELYLELDSGRRIRVAQVGTDSLIVRDDGGEVLARRLAKLVIVVDGKVDEYELLLSKYDATKGIAEFA